MVAAQKTMSVTVRVMFGHTILEDGNKPVDCAINVASDGSDSVLQIKQMIAVRLLHVASLFCVA